MQSSSSNSSLRSRVFPIASGALLALGASLPSQAAALDGLRACDVTVMQLGLVGSATIEKAELVAAANGLPKHCSITGRTGADGRRNIRFNVRMPATGWNQRFFFQGGGGTDGFLSDAVGKLQGGQDGTALAKGYAVASTDSGHDSAGSIWGNLFGLLGIVADFGTDYQLRVDYAYRALELVTKTAKSIVNTYYMAPAQKSFFVGCSNGGRSAFEAAARFGSEYDAVLAGAPAINIAKQVLQAADDAKLLSQASWTGLPGDALTPSEMRLVGQGVLNACDGLDGAVDGIVANTSACQTTFVPDSLQCANWYSTGCLSATKLKTVKQMIAGAKTSNGTPVYAPFVWDPGIASTQSFSSWRTWRIESITGLIAGSYAYPIMTWLAGGMVSEVVSTPPQAFNGTASDAYRFLKAYDLDAGYANLTATTAAFPTSAHALYDVPDPAHLTAFRNRGGKLIVFTGAADPTVSVKDVTNWYDALTIEDAKAGWSTKSYARLYVVPGMNHCGGGPSTDKFDLFGALEKWVAAPSAEYPTVIGTASTANPDVPSSWPSNVQRPLCAYPSFARYEPKPFAPTDYVSATNYVCR
jgi:hypothetical protein